MNYLTRILLVDDSERDIELTMVALRTRNLAGEVLALRDGSEALDYLYRRGEFSDRPQGDPAVILLDVKMPKVDGIEVLRQIKNDPELRMIPVVMLTSSREQQDVFSSYKLGVNGYVVKPVKFPAFVDAVALVGVFWAAINEPPPTSLGRHEPRDS